MANKRFPRTESGEEHESLRELCKGARIFQKSGDTSGGAIALTPWLRYFGNLFGYTGFIGGNQTLIDFVQVQNFHIFLLVHQNIALSVFILKEIYCSPWKL